MGKLLALAALVVIAIGALMHIVALATPSWSVYDEDSDGPYRYCRLNACGETSGGQGNIDAVRALTIIAMLLSLLAWTLVLLIFIEKDFEHTPHFAVGASGASFLSILIGIIIWGVGVQDDIRTHQKYFGKEAPNLGYSFFLSLAGGFLIMGGGVLGFLARRRDRFY